MQPLDWHQTVIPLGSWSLGIILWFRNAYGGNLLPSANTASTVTPFHYLDILIATDFAATLMV
jgi:hypothetical protein